MSGSAPDDLGRKPAPKRCTPFTLALRRLRRDTAGATATEFAIIAFPFMAVLAAIFEVAYVHFETEMLSGAVAKAARAMLTGQAQAASVQTAGQFINTYMCPSSGRMLPANMDCNRLIVDVRTVSSFVAGNMANDFYKSASNVFCPGAPGQIVVVRVAYPLGAIFPLNLYNRAAGTVDDVPGLSGRYHILMGAALFQEENYTGSFSPSPGC